MTHYERLGIRPTATATEIRDAYRAAARRAHPDRHGDASSAQMAGINEAYRVLSDPGRRRRYDDDLRASTPGAPAPSSGAASSRARIEDVVPPPVHTPARFPWRFMAVLASLGVGIVLVGVIFAEPSPAPPVDNILRAGDCVLIGAALDVGEASCEQAHDATVRSLIPFDQTCPADTEAYRDRQGMGIACVVRTSVATVSP